jgi:hypothetical protein
MFHPHSTKYPYTEYTDQHYLVVKKNNHAVFDADYHYFDNSFKSRFIKSWTRVLLYILVWPILCFFMMGLKVKGRKNLKNSLTYSGGSLRSVDNTRYLIGKTRGSLPHNLIKRFRAYTGVRKVYPPAHSAQPHFNNNPLGLRLSAGKNVKYSTFTTRRKAMGHDPQMFSRQYQTTVRWHHRQRDIYKDNYAKYGASRMAMEQNLKNYSNRSVTEMRRTNQNIRYADIHRHTRW